MHNYYLDCDRLLNYYEHLKKTRLKIINNVETIKVAFEEFDWNDRIYQLAKSDMNQHIMILNILLDEIIKTEEFLKKTLDTAEEYLKLSNISIEFR